MKKRMRQVIPALSAGVLVFLALSVQLPRATDAPLESAARSVIAPPMP